MGRRLKDDGVRPGEVACRSSQEFLDLCRRAKAGEIRVPYIRVGNGCGVLWYVAVVPVQKTPLDLGTVRT